ncbi:hypothetical protein RU88_GL000076 [Lactococcus raffinolactis]|nr:hypothetical protein RU88_GL000076 [Lactococcus raffinolactis]
MILIMVVFYRFRIVLPKESLFGSKSTDFQPPQLDLTS